MILRRPTASITLIVAVVILTTFLVSYTPHSPSFLRQQPLVRYRPTNLLDDINNSTFGVRHHPAHPVVPSPFTLGGSRAQLTLAIGALANSSKRSSSSAFPNGPTAEMACSSARP